MPPPPFILVVNDDGPNSPGLWALVKALRKLGRVEALLPDRERSAESHSLTLHKPLRLKRLWHPGETFHVLNGGPADCVRFGVLELFKDHRPNLVVSGINRGYNLGEDIVYSGTVAAAREAAMLGLPSLALSQDAKARSHDHSARVASEIARSVLKEGLPSGVCLNVNFPATPGPWRGAEVTKLCHRIYTHKVTRRSDPRGGHYYWLIGKIVGGEGRAGTDIAALKRGAVSVTPLHWNATSLEAAGPLSLWPIFSRNGRRRR